MHVTGVPGVLIAASFRPSPGRPDGAASPLYDSEPGAEYRLLVSEGLSRVQESVRRNDGASIILSGEIGSHRVQQTITLAEGADHVHVEVTVTLTGSPPLLEYALSPYTFEVDGEPEFIHSPALKFAADDVIGDRVFESPAVMLQHETRFMALVPDLDFINQYTVVARGARQVATGNAFSVPLTPAK
ncbi:MAG: hypothetical protein IPK19_24505 [Chloroflexi bacterium]|nr:hypothetical protein [Chloroflexota bacterium]